MTVEEIREHLKKVKYPGFDRDIVSLGMVKDIVLADGSVRVLLGMTTAKEEVARRIVAAAREVLSVLPGVSDVQVEMEQPSGPLGAAKTLADQEHIPGVRHIIAVASTKGGVGKSTVAVSLALALRALGKKVGLADADVYGPSIPMMMGTQAQPRAAEDRKILPIEKYGIKLISMGFFLDDTSPVIWRGPLVMGLVRQFLKDVHWGEQDYLVIDLPPGTGDAPLTVAQQVPVSGGVIVTTPQDVALSDVKRGIAMFRQVNVPVLGVVENMSYFLCPHCGARDEIFGRGGGEEISRRFTVPVLAKIPLVVEIREGGDTGKPLVVQNPDHPVARTFVAVARQVVEAVDRVMASVPPLSH